MCVKCASDVAEAERKLVEKKKDSRDPGRVVAELGFGFWSRLFNKHYQQKLWNNKDFLTRAFPYATNVQRARPELSVRIDRIRRFRNRVFHHERILNQNLKKHHDDILETIAWVSPELLLASKFVDRFPTVATRKFYERLENDLTPALTSNKTSNPN